MVARRVFASSRLAPPKGRAAAPFRRGIVRFCRRNCRGNATARVSPCPLNAVAPALAVPRHQALAGVRCAPAACSESNDEEGGRYRLRCPSVRAEREVGAESTELLFATQRDVGIISSLPRGTVCRTNSRSTCCARSLDLSWRARFSPLAGTAEPHRPGRAPAADRALAARRALVER
jgi:hypothetical protein